MNEEKELLASDPNTPIATLTELSKHEDSFIKAEVALNSSTPPDLLYELSNDTYIGVRIKVASNLHTPLSTLSELSKDTHHWVRMSTITNRSVNFTETPDIIARLMFDTDSDIRGKAITREKSLDSGLHIPYISHNFIAINPIDEIFEKYDSKIVIMELLLAAAEEERHYDMKSFDQAYQAVTKNGMIPYIAAGIFAISMR